MALFRFGSKARAHARLCLGSALVAICLAGCSGWQAREEGFRSNGLEKTAQTARGQKTDTKAEKNKRVDYWSFSEKGRQIERDLTPQ